MVQGYAQRSVQSPVSALVDRIDRGASKDFHFEITDPTSPEDFFEIGRKGGKVSVVGNSWLSVATGLNWYLRHYAKVQVSWDNMNPSLEYLPLPAKVERHSTDKLSRYYLAAGSASHSTAFWSKGRWQKEVDIMALHGINMPLITLGATYLWRETMLEAEYSAEELVDAIPHPAYEGWWLEGLIEGYSTGAGSAASADFIERRAELSREVIAMCQEWAMTPVVVGFSGFVPSESSKLEEPRLIDPIKRLNQEPFGGITAPNILDAASVSYSDLAEIYYRKAAELYGDMEYYWVSGRAADYSPQPRKAAENFLASIKDVSSRAKLVVSTSGESPSLDVIDFLPRSEVVVVDSWVDVAPQWGDSSSPTARKEGFAGHNWIYSYSGNFDGHTGLYGNLNRIIGGYYLAEQSGASLSLSGVGASIDGVGSNSMLLDLIFDLPWIEGRINIIDWINSYADARYIGESEDMRKVWQILSSTVYSPEYNSEQRGAPESVFAARPALRVPRVSSLGTTEAHYQSSELLKALKIMLQSEQRYVDDRNFTSDLIDIGLIILSNYGYELLPKIERAYSTADREELSRLINNFLSAMLLADNLLNSQRETMLGNHIESAMAAGSNPWERDWLRYGLKTMVSSWGSASVAGGGEMHDRAHRMWGGMVANLYAKRWAYFFNFIEENEVLPTYYDYFDIEDSWAKDTTPYPVNPLYDAALVADEIVELIEREEEK